MLENLVSGIVGGLLVLFVQYIVEHFKNKKVSLETRKVGKPILKIIDNNFLYTYEPHKISIEKIIEDFGQPLKKYFDEFDNHKVEIYQYNFQNAKVIFSKPRNTSDIISITLFAVVDKKNPVLCRMSFEDDDIEFGKAKINDTILGNNVGMENIMTTFGNTCILKCKYFYRQIKNLTFAYEIGGNYKELYECKDQLITQVCISQMSDVTPMLSSDDTFYS